MSYTVVKSGAPHMTQITSKHIEINMCTQIAH